MRKVVDTNYLQSDDLLKYLRSSRANHIVLCDYTSMEIYKGNTIVSIFKSTEIISKFSKQVIILKGTEAVCKLSGRGSGLQHRLIDEKQTNGFSTYCKMVEKAKNGNVGVQEKILELGKTANYNMDNLILTADKVRTCIDEAAKETFSNAELTKLRKGSRFTREMSQKFFDSIMITSIHLYRNVFGIKRPSSNEEYFNKFIFRFVVCIYFLVLRFTKVGGAHTLSLEKMRNDMVDLIVSTYATYFDGLLTKDQKLERIYLESAIYISLLLSRR